MRIIDAESSELQTQLKIIREAEYQIYGSGSWGFTAKCEHAINNAPTIQPEPHWIPVTERLPKENYLDDGYVEPSQPVLVYMNYHTCKISRYWGHRKSKGTSDYVIPDWMDLEEYDSDNVIAWRELPEPYKGVTE